METKFSGGDDISFVSTTSGKSNFSSKIADLSRPRMRKMTLQGTVFGLAFAVLLSLSLMTVILLLHQHIAMSSLTTQVQDLRNRVGLLDDKIASMPRSIKHESLPGQNPPNEGSQTETPGTTQTPPIEQTTDSQIYDVLRELTLSMSNLGFDTRSGVANVQKEIEDVTTSLKGIQKSLSESKSISNDIEETINRKLDNAMDSISQFMTKSHTNLVNIIKKNSGSGDVSDGIKEILSVATGVDADVTQVKEFMNAIGDDLTSMQEQFKVSDLIERLDNISHQVRMMGRGKNESLSTASFLETLKSQGEELVKRTTNMSMIQMPLLLKSQVKMMSEIKKEFDIFHNEREKPTSYNRTIPANETFCDNKGNCVNQTVELQHCYLVPNFMYNRLSWKDAKTKCEELGGYLAEINSASEMRYLKSIVSRKGLYWLGAHDLSGKWVWQHSGQRMALNAWLKKKGHHGKGQDKHSGGHCLLGIHGVGSWHPGPCSKSLGYVCERNDGQCWE